MNSQIFRLKKESTLPNLQISLIAETHLTRQKEYILSDFSAATFSMANVKCGTIKIYNQPAQITCISGGTIQYNWKPEDTDEIGKFGGEFTLHHKNGGTLIVPQSNALQIEIFENLTKF